MKILNITLAILFTLFAVVQYNDPDPLMWIFLYMSVAVISGFATMGKYNIPIILGVILVSLIWLGLLLPAFISWVNQGMQSITKSMNAESPHIEFVREFLGLFLVLSTLTYHYFQAKKNK